MLALITVVTTIVAPDLGVHPWYGGLLWVLLIAVAVTGTAELLRFAIAGKRTSGSRLLRVVSTNFLAILILCLAFPGALMAVFWGLLRIATPSVGIRGNLGAAIFWGSSLLAVYVCVVGRWSCIVASCAWLVLVFVAERWMTRLLTLAAVALSVAGTFAALWWLRVISPPH